MAHKDDDPYVAKSAGYKILHNLLYDYTLYTTDNLTRFRDQDLTFDQRINEFIVGNPSTIDTFFQRVKSYFN